MNAKRLIAFALVCCLSFALFAGCAKTEGETSEGSSTSGSSSEGTTGEEGIRTDLIIGTSADVVSPDPHQQNDTASKRAISMLYDTLIVLGKDGQTFEPGLAESWEAVSDTEYVFHLRQGVKFHNGEEMKASDVKFSLERCAESPKSKVPMDSVASVEVVDDYTVKITTDGPFAPFLFNMANLNCSILNEKYTTEMGDDYQTAPMGTGPMKFVSWKPNDSFVVERFDDYWGGAPKASKITIRIIPEPTSLTIALENGEIDFVDSVTAVDAERVKTNPDLKTVEQVQGSVTYIGMNYLQAPLDNDKVRKALAYAVDREAIIEAVLEGYGEILNTVFPPMMPGYNDEIEGYEYNPEKAKELIVEAGYPDGFSIEMATSGDERNRIAQLVQANYAAIGVTLDINLLEWGAYLEYVGGNDHKMFILGWSNPYNPDGNMFDTFHKDRPATTNRCHFENDEVSALIEQARTELDWTKREEMYKQLQQMIMDEPVWIPLFAKTVVIAMNKNLEGVELEPIDNYDFTNAYVVEK